MARPHPLRVLMATPLPTLSEQRAKCYRPSLREVYKIYGLLNKYIFRNRLHRPKIHLARCRDYWGLCTGLWHPTRSGALCEIKLSDKFYCIQWLVAVLAHEMVHQYQWEVLGRSLLAEGKYSVMNHGSTFYEWKDAFAEYNLPLNLFITSANKWFEQQNFTRIR